MEVSLALSCLGCDVTGDCLQLHPLSNWWPRGTKLRIPGISLSSDSKGSFPSHLPPLPELLPLVIPGISLKQEHFLIIPVTQQNDNIHCSYQKQWKRHQY